MEPFENNPEINSTVPESTMNQPTNKESEDSNDTKILQLEQKVQTQQEEIALLKKESSDLKNLFANYLNAEYTRISMLPPSNDADSRLSNLSNIIAAIRQ